MKNNSNFSLKPLTFQLSDVRVLETIKYAFGDSSCVSVDDLHIWIYTGSRKHSNANFTAVNPKQLAQCDTTNMLWYVHDQSQVYEDEKTQLIWNV